MFISDWQIGSVRSVLIFRLEKNPELHKTSLPSFASVLLGGGGGGEMLRRCCAQAVRSFSSPSSSSSSPSTHYHTIQAVPREVVGPRAAAKERSHGRIPSVVFAGGEAGGDGDRPVSRKQLLTTERKQIHSLLKAVTHESFCCTAFQLQIRAGAGSSCLLESGWVLPIKVRSFLFSFEVML